MQREDVLVHLKEEFMLSEFLETFLVELDLLQPKVLAKISDPSIQKNLKEHFLRRLPKFSRFFERLGVEDAESFINRNMDNESVNLDSLLLPGDAVTLREIARTFEMELEKSPDFLLKKKNLDNHRKKLQKMATEWFASFNVLQAPTVRVEERGNQIEGFVKCSYNNCGRERMVQYRRNTFDKTPITDHLVRHKLTRPRRSVAAKILKPSPGGFLKFNNTSNNDYCCKFRFRRLFFPL